MESTRIFSKMSNTLGRIKPVLKLSNVLARKVILITYERNLGKNIYFKKRSSRFLKIRNHFWSKKLPFLNP